MLQKLILGIHSLRNPEKAKVMQGFFKTGPGEYGEGDIFLGLSVPKQRVLAKKYLGLNFLNIQKLLDSKIHEHRMVGVLILVYKFQKEEKTRRGDIFNFYLKNATKINNWDLVDVSSHHIVGGFLSDKRKDVLYELAVSENLWEKRISIVSCYYFIREEEFRDALRIFEMHLGDSHDLIHKAVGWMLREIGKRDEKVLLEFLEKHYSKLPRTTLRYAIERFEEGKRKRLLKGIF
jgi:3-methyladenine DNA glycosylase AlkD